MCGKFDCMVFFMNVCDDLFGFVDCVGCDVQCVEFFGILCYFMCDYLCDVVGVDDEYVFG